MLPQPTNYKPKVMNDIKAQVNKGRFVKVNYLSGVVHYVLMKMSKKMMGMKFISFPRLRYTAQGSCRI